MAVNTFNLEQEIEKAASNLPSNDYLLGRMLLQVFRGANSGSRCLMDSVHIEQHMTLSKPEVPIIQSGYETEYGQTSTSYKETKHDYDIIAKINKFSFRNNHYFLIIRNRDTGEYDYIERKTYTHNTESYGYTHNNRIIDSFKIGDVIKKGTPILKSNGFDDYNNKMNGTNLLTMYLSCDQNMEDSIILSKSAAKKLETNLVKNTYININDNEVLLNLYGDNNNYKTFPDIGENIKNNIFCSIRRIENDNVLYTLSQSRLKDIMLNDRNIIMDGTVADINIYCNNPEALAENNYNSQLNFYYKESLNFAKNICDAIGPIKMAEGKLSYRLTELYSKSTDIVSGKQFFKDKLFSNVIIEVTVIEPLGMQSGDKMSDRYGGKGVVSKVVDDELMPILDNGKHIEVIKNQSTCINRENIGQLHEQSLTFIGGRIIDYFKMGVLSYKEMAKIWYDFVSMVDPKQANDLFQYISVDDEFEIKQFIDSIINEDDAIILSIDPFTTTINIDTIAEIYKKFPWVKPYKVSVPMEDSNGNIRYVETRRPLVAGKIYNYRLKQYAEEKFSVTSLSATNLKNLNTRSRANKIYETKFTKTPIMFGPMESGDLAHLSMQFVIANLMLYSSSPQGRRLFEQLLVGDPYNIDIKLDKDERTKNRNAEIINTLFKTMGLKLVFNKTPKIKKYLIGNLMIKNQPAGYGNYKTNVRDIIGHKDEVKLKSSIANDKYIVKHNMINNVMIKDVKKDE